MPKFMVKASYTTEGARGLLKEGGTGRRAADQKLTESLGGKVEASTSRTAKTTPMCSSTFLMRLRGSRSAWRSTRQVRFVSRRPAHHA